MQGVNGAADWLWTSLVLSFWFCGSVMLKCGLFSGKHFSGLILTQHYLVCMWPIIWRNEKKLIIKEWNGPRNAKCHQSFAKTVFRWTVPFNAAAVHTQFPFTSRVASALSWPVSACFWFSTRSFWLWIKVFLFVLYELFFIKGAVFRLNSHSLLFNSLS